MCEIPVWGGQVGSRLARVSCSSSVFLQRMGDSWGRTAWAKPGRKWTFGSANQVPPPFLLSWGLPLPSRITDQAAVCGTDVTGVTPVRWSPAAFGIFHFGTKEAILFADVDPLCDESPTPIGIEADGTQGTVTLPLSLQ